MQAWMREHGRMDVTQGRSERELEVFDKFCRAALANDSVEPKQGAKVGKGGEHHDLQFARRIRDRKTPIPFCGILFRSQDDSWNRKSDPMPEGSVRIYVKTSAAACEMSDWADMCSNDDALKADKDWHYFEIPERVPLDGEEIEDLVDDAYYAVVGI